MIIDRYTKIVLTVIAFALVALAVAQFAPRLAVAQVGACGTQQNPCYVTNTGINPLLTQQLGL